MNQKLKDHNDNIIFDVLTWLINKESKDFD